MESLLKTDIPSKLTSSRHKLPWINTELKRQIRKKGRRFSKAKKSGSGSGWYLAGLPMENNAKVD